MEPYITQLSKIIRNTDMNNTYKMVWIRSIVEICVLDPDKETIHFDDLPPKIFGYYWNQTIFFDLEQGPNLGKDLKSIKWYWNRSIDIERNKVPNQYSSQR